MPNPQHIKSIRFRNYKALKNFSVSLRQFNILVGPNNSGKSTILGAFRILAEGMRRARSRKPEVITISGQPDWGYRISLEDLPVSTENVFTNYDDARIAKIEFSLSDENELELIFPEVGICYLICRPKGRPVRTPTVFKSTYSATIGFVPVLGPVEHDEPLYGHEAARKALLTHRASRNFRNIWYHFPENFEVFQELIRSSWPGMEIAKPKVQLRDDGTILRMFCPEERYLREIYWAGFGFQVWCQMLTYALGAKNDSLLVIDEPDIYLHSDLQRQLLSLLQELGPDILIATHSTEIITEAEPGDLLVVNKRSRSARRIKNPSELQKLFELLGSNLNPTLTQLAKSRRGLFVEGKDFQILSAFSRKLGRIEVANRSDFAVIPIEGFNPKKVEDYSKGIETTLGAPIRKAIILDRDYKSDDEIKSVLRELEKVADCAHIHRRKEIENYLFEFEPIERAIRNRILQQNTRTGKNLEFTELIPEILSTLTDTIKHEVSGQFVSKYIDYQRIRRPQIDPSTFASEAMASFEDRWADLEGRLCLVSGKQLLALLNSHLQESYDINISPKYIISQFQKADIPEEICKLVAKLDEFRKQKS